MKTLTHKIKKHTRTVCYILSYYSPEYVRTTTMVDALLKIDDVRLLQARNTARGIIRYLQTLCKLIKIRLHYNPDYYILGFRGYEIFWFVRVIAMHKILIYDHLMSPYDSLLNEKKKISLGGFLDFFVYRYEKWVLHHADVVLTDTPSHKVYFAGLFHLPLKKIHAVPVGADEKLFTPAVYPSVLPSKKFEVLFYGSFLPLHGVDIILQAALILKEEPIHFLLIGGNRVDLTDFHRTIDLGQLQNVSHRHWVRFDELPGLIRHAAIGLGGPFGKTGQGQRVITGKTFQFMAMGQPVIIGETDEEAGFIDKENCLIVPQGNAKALAQAIKWASNHRHELDEIGNRGRQLYLEKFSIDNIKNRMSVLFS